MLTGVLLSMYKSMSPPFFGHLHDSRTGSNVPLAQNAIWTIL